MKIESFFAIIREGGAYTYPPVIMGEISPDVESYAVCVDPPSEINLEIRGRLLDIKPPRGVRSLSVKAVYKESVYSAPSYKNRFAPGFDIGRCMRI